MVSSMKYVNAECPSMPPVHPLSAGHDALNNAGTRRQVTAALGAGLLRLWNGLSQRRLSKNASCGSSASTVLILARSSGFIHVGGLSRTFSSRYRLAISALDFARR